MTSSTLPFQIPGEWEPMVLGALCKDSGLIQTGPFGSQLHAHDYVEVGIPSIMPVNLDRRRIREDGIKRVTPADADRLGKHKVRQGDIVFSRRGDVERHGFVTAREEGWLCGTGCLLVRLGSPLVLPEYISFWLYNPEIGAWLRGNAVGTTMPNLNTTIMSRVPVAVPPPAEQSAIVEVLSSLDDKIELNREMNRTLEAMAQAIFRSWFVDFDPVVAKAQERAPFGMDTETAGLFPDRFVDSELGPIPEGFTVEPLNAVAKVVDCLHSKKPDRTPSGPPLLQVFNVGDDGWLNLDDTYCVSKPDYERWSSRFEVSAGDLVVTKTGRVGAVAQAQRGVKAAMGRNMVGLRALSDFLSPAFLRDLMLSGHMRSEIQRLTNQGTILSSLHVKAIRALRLVRPPATIASAYTDRVSPVHDLSQSNLDESRTLAELRDLLLPKLLSGEIRLPEAEEIVEDVA